jgi:ATP synthase F1 delta subunit
VEEIARVYANALFGAAKDRGKLDPVHDQLNEFTDAVSESRDMQLFLFSPYFSSAEKLEGLGQAIAGAEDELVNFLNLLVEKHRVPVIFRIRDQFNRLWKRENKQLDVKITSAVELDAEVVEGIRAEVEKQTGEKVDLESAVDERVLGGIVLQVGNMVLDASVRNRLEKLRRTVLEAA